MTALKLNPARADYTPTHNDTSFRPQDLGIFEPNYNAKSPTSFQDGKTIYHDVFSFTARVKARTELKSSGPWSPLNVATKLDLCLRGDAETWYTNELSPVTRAGLATNLEFWCTALEKRFQQSPTVALDKLERSRYTIQDARAQRSPEQFVQNLIVLGKNAGTISSEYAQILTAYKHIDAPLRLALPKPTITTSISDFMSNVTDAKEIWFDMYQHNNNPSKPDWKSHKHRMTDFKSSSSEEPNMRSQNQDKPRDRFKPPSHQFKSIGRFDNRQSNTPHRINTAQNYTADIQSRQIQDEKQDAQNETLDSYDEVYFQEMDSLSDEDDKPSSKDHQEDAGWLHPMHSYHLSHSAIAKLPFEQSSAVKQQNITASDPSKNITCNICDTKFPSRNKLHHHIKSLHKKSKNSRSNLALHSSNPFTKDLAKIQSIHEGSNNEEILPISTLQLVASNAPKSAFPPGYGFRGRRYAQVQVILHSPANNPTWVCLDSGCTMTLIDKNFLIKECPTINLAKMPSAMTVRGIGAQFHDASKFALLDLFFPDGKGNAGHISRELHVVDDLPAKILIGIDIMSPEGWCVDFKANTLTLPHCASIKVPIITHSIDPEPESTPIFAKKRVEVPAHSWSIVPISGKNGTPLKLPSCDLIFQPYQDSSLTKFMQIVNKDSEKVIVQNNSSEKCFLAENTLLGEIVDIEADHVTKLPSEAVYFSEVPPPTLNTRPQYKNVLASNTISPVSTQDKFESVMSNGVTIFGDANEHEILKRVVTKFQSIWEKPPPGSFAHTPDGKAMSIPLIDNWEAKYKPGQARVYPVGKSDRAIIDQTFDELHNQGRPATMDKRTYTIFISLLCSLEKYSWIKEG